jgi:dTDP-4-amino-4,6-dideoxygalactose transaminase
LPVAEIKIPMVDPGRWYRKHLSEVQQLLGEVLSSGRYLLASRTVAFEQKLADFCNTSYAVAVNSGTDALYLSLTVAGIGDGEVIVPSHTAAATISAIEQAGAIPVFADIQSRGVCLDPEDVERRITERTRAIVAVHMFGVSANMTALRELASLHGLLLLEDCAQAFGATHQGVPVGGLGDMGAFSFYPTKNMGAAGDAGAIVCNDGVTAQRLVAARQYGWDDERRVCGPGINSRMDEFQAAILNLRLEHWPQDFARRLHIAERMQNAVAGNPKLSHREAPIGDVHAYHLFVVECAEPELLSAHLAARGIASAYHYSRPAHGESHFEQYATGLELPNTSHLYERMLSIPLFPELTDTEVAQIEAALGVW